VTLDISSSGYYLDVTTDPDNLGIALIIDDKAKKGLDSTSVLSNLHRLLVFVSQAAMTEAGIRP
jgi:hypothetical protein